MDTIEAIKMALASLYSHRLRSILTLIGIIIGVMTVIVVVAFIQGLNNFVAEEIITLGADVFMVSKASNVIRSVDEWREAQMRKNLTLADLEAVKQACTRCREVGAGLNKIGAVKFGNQFLRGVNVRGWTESMTRIIEVDIIQGRHIVDSEVIHSGSVCVAGYDIVDNLFPTVDPIGKEIRVDGDVFRIIGVAKKQGAAFGQSRDSWVIIPLTTFMKRYGARRSLRVFAKADNVETMSRAEDEARLILRTRRHVPYAKNDDFAIENQQTFKDLWTYFTSLFFGVTLAIAGLSLVVGGIVIMNIMLVSVTERTKEIGIRKSLGARRADIRRQFLVEACTITFFGGIIGIFAGIIVAKTIAAATSMPATIELWSVAVGLIVSTLVGLFFGIYPATKAAKLDPIVALRQE
ncbi:MAG: ABC transporter permease [Acidobacteria bacterium]|nr:ABC transporter permease [Acidobacteriota bacterium]MBI3654903.1 ABC transporter permease [Acidobacteriota bacterium]